MSTKLQPTPLPSNPYSPLTHPNWHAAFNSCIPLERAGSWTELAPHLAELEPSPDVAMLQTRPQVAGRALGYALIHAPNDVGRDCVAREANSCEDDPEILAGLAYIYIFGLIPIFMNPGGGRTPMEESPRFSFEAIFQDNGNDRTGTVVPAGATPKWLTKKLLPRDRFRCVFTDKPDIDSMERGDLDPSTTQPSDEGAYLGVAHIASQLLSDLDLEGMDPGMTQAAQDKFRSVSSPAAVLSRLAGIEGRDILPNLDKHHPANALMANSTTHTMFNQLKLWLTPSLDEEGKVLADTYDTHLQNPLLAPFIGLLPQARFHHHATPDGVDVPPPSRTLLEIHASCARVAHMSGAAGVLDPFYGEGGVLHVRSLSQDMPPNPAGADELVHALSRAQVGAA